MAPRWSRGADKIEPARPSVRAVVGSAKRINLGRRSEVDKLRLRLQSVEQATAWRHYDKVGEVKYAFNYFAAALSRVRLYAAYTEDDTDGPPAPIGSIGNLDRDIVTAARHEVARLNSAHGGQAGLLRTFGLNWAVAGECYLVEYEDKFHIHSTHEMRILGGYGGDDPQSKSGVQIQPRRNMTESDWIDLPKDAFVARIWRPHPAWTDEADSSLMGVAMSCDELLVLSRLIKASAISSIHAGILYVAQELTFERAGDVDATPEPDDPDNPEDEVEDDPFQEELEHALSEVADDGDSPASVMPMVVRGPYDMADSAVKKIDLSRPFDEQAIKLRDAALDRVLNGLDIPKDLVTGMANVRYSNAQQISENLYKAHIEPTAVLACEAFTVTRLRPALLARNIDPDKVARVSVWYDASEVVTAANRANDANEGWDRILISDATWRRDHGYSNADKPEEEEVARRLAEKSTLAPENAIQMLSALLPLIGEFVKAGLVNLHPGAGAPGAPGGGDVGGGGGGKTLTLPSADKETPSASEKPDTGAPPPPGGSPAPAGLVAAGKPVPVADVDIKRLLGIERKLRTSLQTMFTEMTEKALEKAGSRLASKVRGDSAALSKIHRVPKAMVAAALGHEAIVAAGFTEHQLINDSVDEAGNKYRRQVEQAHEQAAKALGVKPTELASADDVDASWSVLRPLLLSFVLNELLRKDRSQAPRVVPMDDVRAALSRAGGGAPATPSQHGPQPGAVLSDRSIQMLMDRNAAELGGYRWVYGISENQFVPHLELDGAEFEGWEDPRLRNPNPTFPKTDHYYPGDHVGCECDHLPVLLPKQPHEGQVVEHIEPAA